jgi:heptose I phosphotransferase
LDQVARVARRLHEGGVNHRDFYICHFLMNVTGGEAAYTQREPELYLIDLHRAQLRDKVPYRWRVKDLAGLLFSVLDVGLTRTDIARFLRIYTGEPLGQTLRSDRRLYRAVIARAIRTYQRDFGRFPGAIHALKF